MYRPTVKMNFKKTKKKNYIRHNANTTLFAAILTVLSKSDVNLQIISP